MTSGIRSLSRAVSSVTGTSDTMSFGLEDLLENPADVGVVVDDEKIGHASR